jgi:hypothetical protein
MAKDSDAFWEIILKTTKYTLVYIIAMVFIGLNITVICGFGYFTYSNENTNTEKNETCYAVPNYMQPLPAGTSRQEADSLDAVNVSFRFQLIFAVGFWVYIFAWLCYLTKIATNYCLAKDILFFQVILSVLLFVGFVHFIFATIWRFDHAGRVCSNPALASKPATQLFTDHKDPYSFNMYNDPSNSQSLTSIHNLQSNVTYPYLESSG